MTETEKQGRKAGKIDSMKINKVGHKEAGVLMLLAPQILFYLHVWNEKHVTEHRVWITL